MLHLTSFQFSVFLLQVSLDERAIGDQMASIWKRIVTISLLLAYTPMVAMASPNLVWCIATDGHSAIEIVAHDDHHISPVTVTSFGSSGHDHQAELPGQHPDDCIDQAIFGQSIHSRKQLTALASLDAGAPVVRATISSINPINRYPRVSSAPGGAWQAPLFPQLRQIKTIVLIT